MTVRILEIEVEPGIKEWHAYHAHIVYHDDPESVDFNPDNNSTVEVMAKLPHSSFLASMMSTKQTPGGDPDAPAQMLPPRQRIIQVICPDPKCGSTSYYPATGDPEARALHARYAEDITGEEHQRRLEMDLNLDEHKGPLHEQLQPYVANAWARADLGLEPMGGHDHLGAMVHGPNRTIVQAGHQEIKNLSRKTATAS